MLNCTQKTDPMAGKHKSLQERSRRQERRREEENHADRKDHVALRAPKESMQKRIRCQKKIDKPIEMLKNLIANQRLKFTGEPTRESGCKFTDIPGS